MQRLFGSLLTVSFALGSFALSTSSLSAIRFQNMPLFWELPTAFWLGLAALVAGTIVWWDTQETRWFHFCLLALWGTYLLVLPELLEIGIRGFDLHIGNIPLLRAGATWQYVDFPGFFLQFSAMQDILGLDHATLTKFASAVLHLTRIFMIGILGWSWYKKNTKQALLFSLVVLTFLWVPLRLDPTPQNMGLTIFFFLLYLLFSPIRAHFTQLIIVAYFAVIVIHPLSALAALAILVFAKIPNIRKVSGMIIAGGQRAKLFLHATLVTIISLATLFLAWFLLRAENAFATGVSNFANFLRDPLRTAEFYAVNSEFRGFAFHLAILFYVAILAWAIVAVVEVRRSLDRKRVAFLTYALPLCVVFATGFYGWESVDRIQLFASPFVAAFLVTERRLGRLPVVFLVFLLILAFTNRYSQEYNQFVPQHEMVGARFVVERIPTLKAVFIGKLWSPSFGTVSGHPIGEPLQVDYSDLKRYEPGDTLHYATFAPRWMNLVVFYHGRKAWDEVQDRIYRPMKATVYTNGKFELYTFLP